MPQIAEMIQQGSSNLWLFIPTAILLGALHGLEPGHSKTMMASFIIAVKGSMAQAALLGLCAAFSHSLVVWILAAVALKFGNGLLAEQAEPYFMLLSALIVIAVALWMYLRTYRDNQAANAQMHAPHGGKIIATGHGFFELEVHEDGVPPHFRLHVFGHHKEAQDSSALAHAMLETIRPDGTRQTFAMVARAAYWESTDEIPEPHNFEAVLTLGHQQHAHRFEVHFTEDAHDHGYHHHHHHDHDHVHTDNDGEYQDAHERAHAEDIARRFAGRSVTTTQIALFGLTGGLVPCPASVTILMICLHLKAFSLGATMVASFSFGLALSMVSVGVIAAWSAQQVGKRFGHLSALARKTPYLSSLLMGFVGLVMAIQAARALPL
jgi:nickel/cobalt exporter